jgi:hypothetical protein
VDPVKIVGAIQLWIYNTKTRKLGVYNAEDESGLKMKGTTIKNYVENTSVSKTLRKPDVTLPIVTDGSKIALRKVMEGIRAKPSKLNGRINKDTLSVTGIYCVPAETTLLRIGCGRRLSPSWTVSIG